jgi:hypothetical protein
MLFGEIIAVYCENRTEHTNTLCGQNAEFLNVKADGTQGTTRIIFPRGLISFRMGTAREHLLENVMFTHEVMPQKV